ncbi:MAG: hypothetical protein KAR38_09370, partial [Calditrichia bacterium]|nr:hypothetical protein [Calditrichia bacterium]
NKSFDRFFKDLYKEYSFSINENLLKLVVTNMETKNRMPMINKANISESQLKETVIDYKSGKWTLETMIDNYNSSQIRGKMPLKSKDIAIDYIYKTITPDLIYKKAVAEGYDKDEKYLEKIKSLEEQQVKRVCQQKLLNEKVNVTEEEIENYYNENKEKYKDKTLDKVRTRIKNELSSKKRKELKANVIKELKEKFTIAYNDIEIDRITVEMNEQKKKDEEAKAAKAKLKEKETEKTKPSDIDKKEEKTKKKK